MRKERLQGHIDPENTIYSISMHQTVPFLVKNGHFLVQNGLFWRETSSSSPRL